jgi:hypothetical protein
MRIVSSATMTTWQAGNFTGPHRPMVRATIQRLSVQVSTFGGQTYSCIPLGQSSTPVEIPNIKSVK